MWLKKRGSESAETREGFLYLRVDDRLIHGQVVIGWGEALCLNRLVLINDCIAADPAQKEFYLKIIPAPMHGAVISAAQAPREAEEIHSQSHRGLLVVATVTEALQLVGAGIVPDLINLGSLRAAAGRQRLVDYVYLTPSDLQALLALTKRGIRVNCQDLPTRPTHSLESVIPTIVK